MELQTGSQMLISAPAEEVPSRIMVDGISVAYSSGRRPDGSWFALGTIANLGEERMGPAIVLVGLGNDLDDALNNLSLEVHNTIAAHKTH
jgi:hypothetical protein